MSKLKKSLIFLYLALAFILLSNVATKVIVNPNYNVFKYVPLESDLIIEINAPNFINEFGYQKVFKSNYFDEKNPIDETSESPYEIIKTCGINLFSKFIVFRENWSNEPVWFVLISIDNEANFKTFCTEFIEHKTLTFFKGFALIQLNASSAQNKVDEHIQNIADNKVKSIQSKSIVQENFLNENEINIYLKSSKSDFITDGFLNINFYNNKIGILGHFTPVGNEIPIKPINYAHSSEKAFSLRSSLNLFQTLYLFKDTKLEALPDYDQLLFDYDGATLLTINENIPIHTYPKLNLNLVINDRETWMEYLYKLVDEEKIQLKNDTFIITTSGKGYMKYKMDDESFSLFQDEPKFKKNEDPTLFLSLSIIPSMLLDKTFFKKDEKNPPKMFANMKISVIQSLLESFQYLKEVEKINFNIKRNNSQSDYISEGEVVYTTQDGHSMIESFVLFSKFVDTFGAILN